MDFRTFKLIAEENKWTLPMLRCDVRPPLEMLTLMNEVGLDVWERHVLLMQRQANGALGRAYLPDAAALVIGHTYRIDSGIGGTYSVVYRGVQKGGSNPGTHHFQVLNAGWTKTHYYLTALDVPNRVWE